MIFFLRRFYKKLNVGTCCGIYFIIYGVERFLVESLRQDSLMLGSIKIAQLVSVIGIIIGIVCIILSLIKKIPYLEDNLEKEE